MTALFELAARLQSANAAEAMLWMLLRATLILAIGRLFLAALPRASAAAKHLIATVALIGAAAVPLFTAVAPAIELPVVRAQSPEARRTTDTAPPTGNREPGTIGLSDQEPIATAISVARASGLADKPLSLLERSTSLIRSTWKGLAVITVATLSLLMLGQMLLGMIGVWFVSRQAEELTGDVALRELDEARDRLALARDVRLLSTPRVAVPVVWGFFRPVLLLPADVRSWPAERLRVVLLHELAHLKRWDGVSLILTRIALALFWFHPLAWTLERAGRSECERACDDLVLASGTKPSEYADHLLAIARSMPAFDPFRSVTLAMSRKSQLEGRLLSILQKDVTRRVFSVRGVIVACAVALAVIIPVSAVRLIATPSDTKTAKAVVKEEPVASGSELTVTPDVEAIGDYLLAKMGGEPRHAEGWYDRAYDLYRDERYAEAAVAFRRAGDEGYRRATAYYNAACSYALLGDATRALAELDRAIGAGWDDFDKIADDSDFDPIRRDPRFRSRLESHLADVATRREHEAMAKLQALRAQPLRHDDDGWFEAGLDLLRLRKLDESIEAFERSITANEKVSTSMYNIACAYSLKQDARNGMAWLEKSIEHGFVGHDKLVVDPDLAFLRTQPGFPAAVQRVKDLDLRGCCSGPMRLFIDNWKPATEHHRAMVRKYPHSGRAHFNLGFAALQARDFATAQEAFRGAIERNYRVATSSYNVACAHALQGNRDAAFEWLKRAKSAGFEQLPDHAEDDEDLESLHGDPRWKALLASR